MLESMLDCYRATVVNKVAGLTDDQAFTAAVPAPMTIGTVELADGRQVSGFLVEPYAVEGAPDITRFGGWRASVGSV